LSAEQRQRFDRFWEAYPHKKSKGQAESAFAKLNPDELMLERMLRAIRQQADHRKQLEAAGQFVPEHKHPGTWISAKAWEDELAPVQQRSRAGKGGEPDWDDISWADDLDMSDVYLAEPQKHKYQPARDNRQRRAAITASVMNVQDASW
jgi:hypothetical protein